MLSVSLTESPFQIPIIETPPPTDAALITDFDPRYAVEEIGSLKRTVNVLVKENLELLQQIDELHQESNRLREESEELRAKLAKKQWVHPVLANL